MFNISKDILAERIVLKEGMHMLQKRHLETIKSRLYDNRVMESPMLLKSMTLVRGRRYDTEATLARNKSPLV